MPETEQLAASAILQATSNLLKLLDLPMASRGASPDAMLQSMQHAGSVVLNAISNRSVLLQRLTPLCVFMPHLSMSGSCREVSNQSNFGPHPNQHY